ncbi:hypothetical protein NM04_00640 [Massilia aurea]|uniref:Uncharacterized protein n=1 Tax=Massilia aurea TaxID=373040 RepID=A0A422QRK1_9BURK|nr:protein YgfX [Massilia aurea]RNF32648.1 hypothetical protein NM04_00640 [Massilia aurea]
MLAVEDPPPPAILSLILCSMSLAVSAVIAPSRRLRCLLAAFCASLCAAALAVGLLLPERFAFGGAVACAPLLAALSLARLLTHSTAILHSIATVRRIDISGVGQLRLTVQQELGEGGPAAAIPGPGPAMTLLQGATVWPCCIVLRLRAEDGATWPLVLLPDAVGAGQYRALAVAVRALANGVATIPIQNSVNLLQGANS